MFDAEKVNSLIRKYQSGTDWQIPGGASAERIAEYERELGFGLPDDFKAWVMLTNGPVFDYETYFGVPGALKRTLEKGWRYNASWKAQHWIPIQSDDSGCIHVMPTNNEYGAGFPILYFDIDHGFDEPTCIEASDLQHYLEAYLEEAYQKHRNGPGSTYHADGELRKKKIVERDPELFAFKGAPYRWEI